MSAIRTTRCCAIAGSVAIAAILQAACDHSSSATYTSSPPYTLYADGAPAPQYQAQPPAAGPVVGYTQLNEQQIDQLTQSIALYPDPLLAQLLPAATYPLEVVEAERWLQANTQPTEDAINAQPWESPIKALVHYPTVLQMMNDHLEWTQALGAAYLNQPTDVMNSVQRLRAQASAAGYLQSTTQQQVFTEDRVIYIEPANPQILYVPEYDPQVIFVERPVIIVGEPVIFFSAGFTVGWWFDNDCDWHHHDILVRSDWRRHYRDEHLRNTTLVSNTTINNTTVNNTTINNRTVNNTAVAAGTPVTAGSTGQAWKRNTSKPAPALPAAAIKGGVAAPRGKVTTGATPSSPATPSGRTSKETPQVTPTTPQPNTPPKPHVTSTPLPPPAAPAPTVKPTAPAKPTEPPTSPEAKHLPPAPKASEKPITPTPPPPAPPAPVPPHPVPPAPKPVPPPPEPPKPAPPQPAPPPPAPPKPTPPPVPPERREPRPPAPPKVAPPVAPPIAPPAPRAPAEPEPKPQPPAHNEPEPPHGPQDRHEK